MSETPYNWNQWVGLPFRTRGRGPDRYDCFGLVRAVLKDAQGIPLPALLDDAEPVDQEAHDHLERWVLVEAPEPLPFDILLYNMLSGLPHLGLAVNASLFLHVTMGGTSHVERFYSSSWKGKFRGIYRYQAKTVCGMKEKETRPMKEPMVSSAIRCSVCLEFLPIGQANKETRGPCEPVGRSGLICPRCVSIASLAGPEISMSEKKR